MPHWRLWRTAKKPAAPVVVRLARTVIPGIPHHATQRGNARAQTFYNDDDYRFYLDLLAEHTKEAPQAGKVAAETIIE
ncbi:MAG: hypothetical protein GY717_21470 [Rhodobacteraceae bacterium]|nr:hypothetical protein [Paracoccaceae bacterium]